MKFIFPEKTGKSDMIKLILEITRNNLFKSKKSEKSVSCQSVFISGTFYAKSREKYMELDENKEQFEGKTQGIFYSGYYFTEILLF